MKKSFIKQIIKISAFSLLGGLFFACGVNAGLGPEVDVTAPTITLTSHTDNDTVPSVFTLQGTAWDNEKITALTLDFEDADLHYRIVPGGAWYKKNANTDWVQISDENTWCVASDGKWKWSIFVDTSDKCSSKTDSTFEFSAIVTDAIGNSSKNSKVECSLTVDTNNPEVSLNSPTIFTGTYSEADTTAQTYSLKDGNVIAHLLNGDLTFSGRQANSISFKELRIEFDDGQLEVTADKSRKVTGQALADKTVLTADEVAEAVAFENDTKTKVYYSKTFKRGEDGILDLRNWDLTIPQSDWVSDEKNPEMKTGMHLIRLVTTSVSDAYAWERKVLGYFVWWPEADIPWITTYLGDDEDKGSAAAEMYPSSNFSGFVQDDDGIKSLTYSIDKKNEGGTFDFYSSGTLNLSEEEAKYSAWTVKTPAEEGNYSLTVTVEDLTGNVDSVTKYFKNLDVSPPRITIETPASSSSVLAESDATIKFKGYVSDDSSITSFYVAFLNPAKSNDVENKIRFMSGSDTTAAWKSGTANGYTDSDGNKIYKITLSDPIEEGTGNRYNFERTFNLFKDLEIDGDTKPLEALDFVFRAEDNGGTPSVEVFGLSGDTEAPSVALSWLVLKDASGTTIKDYDLSGDETPTLPVIEAGYTAEITGTWSDNSTEGWNADYKRNVRPLKLTWGDKTISAELNANGTWSASVSSNLLPTTSGLIKAVLTDFGGNSKIVTHSVFIESNKAGLESIGCEKDDGAYKVGETIEITLEFTKETVMTQGTETPTLTLNNGKTATYSSGSGNSKHIYTYKVASGDDIAKLDVTKINPYGATWSSNNVNFDVKIPPEAKRIGTTRNIKIDTIAPSISSIKAISANGSYTVGAQILLMLTFSEDVSVASGVSVSNLALEFMHQNNSTYVKTGAATLSGSKSILFTYTVASGDNTNLLTLKGISTSLSESSFTDEAGNELSKWAIPSGNSLGKTIIIDTIKPNPPSINGAWGSESVVLDENGTSFTVSGAESTIEYSLDGGSSWLKYDGTVSLKNNGTYRITARQTDAAGNTSENAEIQEIVVDKGYLLQAITASTVSGSYSCNTNTKAIEGLIKFRSNVTIQNGATVTLNVKDSNGSFKKPTILGSGSTYSFTYKIEEGDYIENDVPLDVTAWSLTDTGITFNEKNVAMDFGTVVTENKKFSYSREIYIKTGTPTVKTVSLTGEGSAGVLKITFDRNISKVEGNIVLTQDESTFKAPAVLSKSAYNSIANSWTAISGYYKAGTNGATLNGDNTLKNDTEVKYILTYDTSTDDNTVTAGFKTAKYHIKSIPIVASAVEASGAVLTVKLGETYCLPTKGANYSVLIPERAVTDDFQNTNGVSNDKSVYAPGVEAPEIRIQKSDYKINNAGNTAEATVEMPETAKMRIDCRTPGASISYSKHEIPSEQVSVIGVTAYTTKTKDVSISSSYSNYDSEETLGSEASDYDTLQGLKIAIAAKSSKEVDGTPYTATSYEYATRTVLKFNLDGSDSYDKNHKTDSTDVVENSKTYSMRELQVWIQGGDSAAGTNTISTFPLSWGKETYKENGETKTKFNYKLMHAYVNNKDWAGKWAWVTWDLSSAAYHGFVVGNVPDDALKNGPSICYAGECAWNALKGNYVLYPGETLEMCLTSDTDVADKGAYFFRTKNKLTR